jgi:hypothetical protein
MMRHAMFRILLAALVVLAAPPAHAYLHLSIPLNGQSARLKWNTTTIRWHASNQAVPGVTSVQFQAAVARAFATWQVVPTASISFEFGGITPALPFEDDGLSVVGFLDQPDLDRVLGATGFLIDAVTGEILESDVFFNSSFPWSTAEGGDPARFDVESVAVHEVGHLLGLGHSAIGETELRPTGGRRVLASGTVMFPIAFDRGNIADRELQPDDVAGVSDLYPAAGFRSETGIARGRVLQNGRGVLGAHVVAFNPRTGAVIGGFTLNEQGEFHIAGLTPGPHLIRVEPLDDAEVDSYFFNVNVDLDFQVTFFPRLLVAPAGGAGDRVEVAVTPKASSQVASVPAQMSPSRVATARYAVPRGTPGGHGGASDDAHSPPTLSSPTLESARPSGAASTGAVPTLGWGIAGPRTPRTNRDTSPRDGTPSALSGWVFFGPEPDDGSHSCTSGPECPESQGEAAACPLTGAAAGVGEVHVGCHDHDVPSGHER